MYDPISAGEFARMQEMNASANNRTIQQRIDDCLNVAEDAFWAVVVKHFPEAKTGDLGPGAVFAFSEAQRRALQSWLEYNYPVQQDDWDGVTQLSVNDGKYEAS